MFGLGPLELGIIVSVVVLLFGPKQIPKFARSIAETIKEVKNFNKDVETETKKLKKNIKEIAK